MQILTDNEVRDEMQALVRNGKVRWREHAEERMVKHGYDKDQIKRCLLSGYFVERPVIANRTGASQYKFTLRAKVDGETIEVAASLTPKSKVLVITVINVNSQYKR